MKAFGQLMSACGCFGVGVLSIVVGLVFCGLFAPIGNESYFFIGAIGFFVFCLVAVLIASKQR